ncbi:MAG: serine/threonine protein kinase [Deltaproteobacteria bacterium]|nr:MAG: serine/threonine protein kinase [Deltaproteobacteria bacterium]
MSSSTASSSSSGRRFHLRRLLGAGAFGEVYLAEMISSGDFRRRVAIKLLHADVAQNRGAAQRMRDEARILGRLSHRNIVSVLDLIKLEDRWAVIMDYVPGADLEQVLERCVKLQRATPLGAVFEVGAAVARALHAAWSTDDGEGNPLKVVHRDIKPSNIRLTPDGEVKVLDFGVARVEMDTREAATREVGWIGTERYMAPERIMMLGDTPAGDVYALGASLVELILGAPLGRTPVLPDKHRPLIDEAMSKIEVRLNGHPATAEVIETLRSTLHDEPERRASAAELAKSFPRLARRLGGGSLAEFAGELVPPLIEQGSSEVVDQVLSEEPTTAGAMSTLALPDEVGPPDAEDQPAKRGALLGLVLGGGAAVAVAGGGVLVLLLAVIVGLWLSFSVAPIEPSVEPSEIERVEEPPVLTEPASPQELSGSPEPPGSASEGSDEVDEAGGASEPVDERESAPATEAEGAPVASPSKPTPAKVLSSPPEIPADAPRVRSAKVLFAEASSLSVTCGDRHGSGSSSVALRNAPAGPCVVRATWLGEAVETTIQLEEPTVFTCAMQGEEMSCASS